MRAEAIIVVDEPLKPVLTLEEVAECLRVPVAAGLELARKGRLPGRKIGEAWRFSRAAIEAWLSRATPEPEELSEEELDDRAWLEADLAPPLSPYDWGSEGPPKGKPVKYSPGRGLCIVDDEDYGTRTSLEKQKQGTSV